MATPAQVDRLRAIAGEPPTHLASQLEPLSVEQVLAPYVLGDALTFVDDELTTFTWTEEGDELGWSIALKTAAGANINAEHPDQPGVVLGIERRLMPDAALRSAMDGRGRVASSVLLCVAAEHRGRGVASVLHQRERSLFAAWGACEFQIDAGCEAKTSGFWLRHGFELSTWTRLAVEQIWADRCHEIGLMLDLPPGWAEWPADFREKVCEYLPTLPLYARLP